MTLEVICENLFNDNDLPQKNIDQYNKYVSKYYETKNNYAQTSRSIERRRDKSADF